MFYLCNLLTTQLMFTLSSRTLSFTSYKRCAMQTHPINARKHLILFALTRRAKIDGGETNKNSISSKQKKKLFFGTHAIDLLSGKRFFTPALGVNGNLYSIFGFLNYS